MPIEVPLSAAEHLALLTAADEPWGDTRQPLRMTEQWQNWWQQHWVDLGGTTVGRTARAQGFVLTSAQAGAGSPAYLRRQVRSGAWIRPSRGAVAPLVIPRSDDPFLDRRRQHVLTATAAALTHTDQVIAARSSAILRGLPTFAVPERPELTARVKGTRVGNHGPAHSFAAGVTDAEVTEWFGAPVLTVVRTLVDLARHDRWDAIMAADLALRDGLVTRGEIDSALAMATGWPGIRQAREVLALADPKAESPAESLIRLRLHDDGFPRPELQVPAGGYWLDMVLDGWLVLEVDGLKKYTGPDALRQEKLRETRLRRLGYPWVERVIWADLTTGWPAMSRRLRDLLRNGRPLPASRNQFRG